MDEEIKFSETEYDVKDPAEMFKHEMDKQNACAFGILCEIRQLDADGSIHVVLLQNHGRNLILFPSADMLAAVANKMAEYARQWKAGEFSK